MSCSPAAHPPHSHLFPYTTLFRSDASYTSDEVLGDLARATGLPCAGGFPVGHGEVNEPLPLGARVGLVDLTDRKSTRLNSSHLGISYAVFCLTKKKCTHQPDQHEY